MQQLSWHQCSIFIACELLLKCIICAEQIETAPVQDDGDGGPHNMSLPSEILANRTESQVHSETTSSATGDFFCTSPKSQNCYIWGWTRTTFLRFVLSVVHGWRVESRDLKVLEPFKHLLSAAHELPWTGQKWSQTHVHEPVHAHS